MKLPPNIKLSLLGNGFSTALICSQDSLHEKFNFLPNHPAAAEWMQFRFEQKGNYQDSKKARGTYIQTLQTGHEGKFILPYVSGTTKELDIFLKIFYHQVAIEQTLKNPVINSYSPPLAENGGSHSLLIPLKVNKTKSIAVLETDQNPAKPYESYNSNSPGNLYNTWLSKRPLQIGPAFALKNYTSFAPLSDVVPSFCRMPQSDNGFAVFLGVTDGNTTPSVKYPEINALDYISAGTETCCFVVSRSAVMEWVLPLLCKELNIQLSVLKQGALDGTIEADLPYPLNFANGNVIKYAKPEFTQKSSINISFLSGDNSDGTLGILEIKIHSTGTWADVYRYTLRYSRTVSNGALYIDLTTLSLPDGPPQSFTDITIKKGLKSIFRSSEQDCNGRPMVLPESDQFIFSNRRVVKNCLVLTATPKY